MKRILTSLALATFVAVLHTTPWSEALELRFLDLWFALRGPISPPSDVVVVAMDEESYDLLGLSPNQPLPRALHAQLLNKLADAGARKVIFDILFLGESPRPEDDAALAAAMRRVPTVIGADLGEQKERSRSSSRTLFLPHETFRAAARLGLTGFPEQDGRIRSFLCPTTKELRDMVDDLPLSLAAAVSGATNLPGPRDFIRFYGGPGTIPTCSFEQVLDPDVPATDSLFKNKLIFVGLSLKTDLGPTQKDSYLTSYSRDQRVFGVEIHATATANLLQGSWIKRQPFLVEALSLGLLALLLSVALFHLRPIWGGLLLAGYAIGWSTLAYQSFLRGAFLPGATLAVVVLPFTYLGATLSNYLITRLQQLRLERAFQQYLSPEMAREVARNPRALRLGGEEIECTAMFTDIAGFTSIVERMKPEEVSRMLNAYFTEVMDAVFDKRGTMIQFIGDGVYALWGAPIRTVDHARLCCQAALAIQTEIERFNQSGRFPTLRTRFGINTGQVLVGNLGSVRRFDFTGIGDTVNLASRLEGLNKQFGTTILLTDTTRSTLPPEIHCLKLGLIRAVGKTQPVGLHTLFHQAVSPEIQTHWADACSRFIARDWDAAAQAFTALGLAEPRLAKAADLYAKQIIAHRTVAPPPEWQGEIIFTSK